MVVSRNDIKRKRKDSDTTVDTLPDSPKRLVTQLFIDVICINDFFLRI